MKNLFIMILIISSSYLIYAQTEDEIQDKNFSQSLSIFFPKNNDPFIAIGCNFAYGNIFSFSQNIKSQSFISLGKYTSDYPGNENELKIKKPFSDNFEDEDSYSYHFVSSINITYFTDSHIHFRLHTSLHFNKYNLYSLNNNLLLNENNKPEPFTENSIVRNREVSNVTGGGLLIPLYGYFDHHLRFNNKNISSLLFLYTGFSAAYPLSTKADQYLQIADKKDILRYGNGTDTLRIINGEKLSTINMFRSFWDIETGFHYKKNNFGLEMSFSYSLQLNSILEDTSWKQNFWDINFTLLYFIKLP